VNIIHVILKFLSKRMNAWMNNLRRNFLKVNGTRGYQHSRKDGFVSEKKKHKMLWMDGEDAFKLFRQDKLKVLPDLLKLSSEFINELVVDFKKIEKQRASLTMDNAQLKNQINELEERLKNVQEDQNASAITQVLEENRNLLDALRQAKTEKSRWKQDRERAREELTWLRTKLNELIR